jgi:hypothetical protein
VSNEDISYRNYKIGDVLPKTKYEILDIIIHDDNSAQFYLETGNGQHWYDGNTVIYYEKKKEVLSAKNNVEMSL